MSKKSILVIDDDCGFQEGMKRLLNKAGYRVLHAESGKAGLEILRRESIDLILLDIIMPEMNGFEVCRSIRKELNDSLIKIVLISGRGDLENRIEGYKAGADDFISKPFNIEELVAKIRILSRLKREEEISQMKGDLLALFSHETKTPISAIMSVSDILINDPSISNDTRDLVELMKEGSHQLLEFVDKATLLCNLKNGLTISLTPSSLADHVKEAVDRSEDKAAKKRIGFEVEVEKEFELNADWKLLDIVLDYIIDNAIKFSDDEKLVKISSSVNNDICELKIADTGPGIAPKWVNSIFEEFAIQDVLHHSKGQGLSLAIARNIIDLHGGDITVESDPGQDTVFTITVPV